MYIKSEITHGASTTVLCPSKIGCSLISLSLRKGSVYFTPENGPRKSVEPSGSRSGPNQKYITSSSAIALQGGLVWEKVEDWNWETIFTDIIDLYSTLSLIHI